MCDEVDAAEDEVFGSDSGNELPEHLLNEAGRVKATREAMGELEEEAKDKARAEQEERPQGAETEGRLAPSTGASQCNHGRQSGATPEP